MEWLGYAAALLIGISLGVTGSGGSILTVPILVYLMGLSPVVATAYSLFVVGTTSLVGSVRYYRKRLVCFKTALLFGIPSLLTVVLTRGLLLPALPARLFTVGSFAVTRDAVIMLLFALLMVAAAYRMIGRRKGSVLPVTGHRPRPYLALLGQGTLVGLVSGVVGAGGGFLIIPALVLFTGLSMPVAIGTSLVIIAANSLFGFVGDLFHYDINWGFLVLFSSLSIAGIFLGAAVATRLRADSLKRGFGWFILLMGLYIILREVVGGGPG
ncbi:sulfite exporter TauE/SafE family protein [Rufibacter psychrotolerans]|uniref:sulfite exporter TauE/SafE family protein n=1 Tax=Rufibacter psychrotolerans TaxID=2812556 RepID=UPI001967D6E7|nr:sulfite exporter TauE/SafE family protein [Rufibacter sp. SYSU D00308]